MTPDDEPDAAELPEEYQYWTCPECGERNGIDVHECCSHWQDDCDIEGDWEAYGDYCDDARAEAEAEAKADRMEDW